ncbi:hypothetical protein L484_009104 [Morus notabilis]|uniref:Uncharacterized protein n=1 Tax=Morus notabilis TaxID=981085 RepID=W9QR75_9ROSA|nr:hypothetical protein L484_009104 [Morus notabilis]
MGSLLMDSLRMILICTGRLWSDNAKSGGPEAWSKEAHRRVMGSLLRDAGFGKGWSPRQIFGHDVDR